MISRFFSFLMSVFRPMSASTASKSDSAQQNSSPPSVFLPRGAIGLDISEYMILLNSQAVKTSDGRAELSKHIITKLEHMKLKKGAEHEYIIATVKYNDAEVRLSIERTTGPELPKDFQPTKSPVTFSSKTIRMASIPNSSQDSLFKPKSARDLIRYIGYQPSLEPSRVFVTFSPHFGVLDLLQLAAIIEAVHAHEERYALLRSQCYWFAMSVMGAAMTRGGHVRYAKPVTRGGQVRYARGHGQAETEQDLELPTVASTADLSHIPVSPPPPDEEGELVKITNAEGVGEYRRIPIVAVSPKDIQIIAEAAERRYGYLLEEAETEYASLAQVKRIEELEEEGKKNKEELQKKDEEIRKKDEEKDVELRKKDEELRKKDELIRQLLSQPQAESSQH